MKQGPQSLRMKIRKSKLYFKGATVITPGSQSARFPELASKLIAPTGSTPSTGENIGARLQLITRRVSDDTKLLRLLIKRALLQSI